MQKLNVSVLAALPREVELIAETARLLGLNPHKDFPHLRAICVAGELVVQGRLRHLGNLWNVPVYNVYGSTETGTIATTCSHGVLHIVEEDFYMEVLQDDLKAAAGVGERGRAVVTTLSHQGSPLLRYDNRDIIAVQHGLCKCGNEGAQLIHYGRVDDQLDVTGRIVHAKDVQDAIYDLSPVPEAWKVIQREAGLQVLLESSQAHHWDAIEIQQRLEQHLQVPVSVEIVEVGTLLDRDKLLTVAETGKPVYIEKHEEWSEGLDLSGTSR